MDNSSIKNGTLRYYVLRARRSLRRGVTDPDSAPGLTKPPTTRPRHATTSSRAPSHHSKARITSRREATVNTMSSSDGDISYAVVSSLLPLVLCVLGVVLWWGLRGRLWYRSTRHRWPCCWGTYPPARRPVDHVNSYLFTS